MNFFELVDQFFQLNSQQPIPPLAAKLYLYWLHEFNQARWPAVLYRRANQVYADLPCDKNTFSRAVAQLQERGLLDFDTTSKGWQLNYGPAADWLPAAVVNYSPQTAPGMVNNSPRTAQLMVNNSPQDAPESDEKLHLMVNNSPPIRNNQYVLANNQPTPSASVCVGEAAEEITLAPLPAGIQKLVPPRPPHAGQSGPVAAAELPAGLAAEAKALANELATLWDFTELSNQPRWAKLHRFARRMATLDRLPEVRRQLAGYLAGHLRPGVRPHKLDTWLGSPDDEYAQGEWCSCDWPGVATKVQQRPNGPAPTPTRASTSTQKTAAQTWS